MNATAPHRTYAEPTLECDLVMKGGVTSGLVYPPAVLELARTETNADGEITRSGYRFRSIGGSSAGAVAAAFAAAAEFNRPQGFDALEKVNADLQSDKGGTSYLRRLFQATPGLEPLLDIVLRLDDYGKDIEDAGLLRVVPKIIGDSGIPGLAYGAVLGSLAGVIAAAVLGAVIAFASHFVSGTAAPAFWTAFLVLGVLLGLAGACAGWIYKGLSTLFRLVSVDLAKNHFGICSGMTEAGHDTHAATDWIHASIQSIAGHPRDAAGQEKILTFGDLRNCKPASVALELMTTNVSEGRPYALPFDDPYVFRKADLKSLFPQDVIDALERGGTARSAAWPRVTLPEGYCFLPAPDDLPVVFAARMSMSFPLFFSSIPLYALPLAQRDRLGPALEYACAQTDLIPHWFSDGGIASNFPIHFFDAWLPTRPTFGITLRYLPRYLFGQPRTAEEKRAAEHYRRSAPAPQTPQDAPDTVVLPRAADAVPAEWSYIRTPASATTHLDAVPNFVWAVIGSMQNYRDNLQAALPSYRERVAQVRLRPDEGGFNLDMEPAVIQTIVGKGVSAGTKLDTEFVDDHHRWVRLRLLMSELESGFRAIRAHRTDERFAELIDRQCGKDGWPYPIDNRAECDALSERLTALRQAMDTWVGLHPRAPFDAGLPPPVMRVTPKI